MCFTLADLAPSFSSGNNLIHVFLNTTRTFIVFVHDPKFFVYTYNPQAIPMTTWILPKTKTFVSLSLVETTHADLNLPKSPCQEDRSYNFQVLETQTHFFSFLKSSSCVLLIMKISGMHQKQSDKDDRLSSSLGRLE